jgi:glyoxylase-like metal-dependent hydrolase (beta-lactamase superfamily II)
VGVEALAGSGAASGSFGAAQRRQTRRCRAEAPGSPGDVAVIDRVRISGVFVIDAQEFEVENNVWIVGDSSEVVVVDAAHDHEPIAQAVGGRRTSAIIATHGHNDHINAAVVLGEALRAPVLMHPADLPLWREVYPDALPDAEIADGDELSAGGVTLRVVHTPGHTPGGCCLYDAESGTVFSGDTLFRGGPGATGRSWSDFPTIIESIRTRLLVLAPETRVLTGHGDETTIGDEAPHLNDWIARGY